METQGQHGLIPRVMGLLRMEKAPDPIVSSRSPGTARIHFCISAFLTFCIPPRQLIPRSEPGCSQAPERICTLGSAFLLLQRGWDTHLSPTPQIPSSNPTWLLPGPQLPPAPHKDPQTTKCFCIYFLLTIYLSVIILLSHYNRVGVFIYFF